ncbi:MAG: glycosyltransferase family 4 protein [bacterium]|nr:glycosyltransferase family 4 protein [bacterium]
MYLKYFSNKNDYQVHFITNGGDSLERLKEINSLHFKILKFSTGISNIFQLANFYKEIKKYLIANKIDLVHSHHRFPEFILSTFANKLSIKTVFSPHGFVYGYKRFSFKSDLIISVSYSATKNLIDDYGVEVDKIRTIYNPVNKEQYDNESGTNNLKSKYSLPNDYKVILFMGRITLEKGYDTLLKAFIKVNEKFRKSFLILSGSDQTKNLIYKLTSDVNNIQFLQPGNNSEELFSIADIVVLPSRSDTFPFVMIEAGSFKKPFIGGNTGGIAEFIEDGKDGLLIDPENHEQLAERIIYLLNNPETGKIMGLNLHEKVKRLCNYNSYFCKVEKIYNSLITS